MSNVLPTHLEAARERVLVVTAYARRPQRVELTAGTVVYLIQQLAWALGHVVEHLEKAESEKTKVVPP